MLDCCILDCENQCFMSFNQKSEHRVLHILAFFAISTLIFFFFFFSTRPKFFKKKQNFRDLKYK